MTQTTPGAGSYLGSREGTGVKTTAASLFANPYGVGLWQVLFDPKVLAFAQNVVECYHIALKGPAGSAVQVFIDNVFFDATPNGDINSYDPQHPIVLRGGQSLVFDWNVSATPAPFVTTWWRLPLVGG
jgi:hypothetical protein